jgi:hypothetical protein
MRRFIFLSLTLVLASCDPAGLTDTPTGAYVEEKDITETGDPEFLTKGCDSNGDPVYAVDPALKVGTIVGQLTKLQTSSVGTGELDITTEVTSLTADTIVQKYTVNKVSTFSGYTAGQTFNVACDFNGCTSDGPSNTGAEHSKYEDCQFTAQPVVTGKLTKGKYSFKNGPSVTAFKMTLTGKGPIKCGTEEFPEALVEQSLLTSNDIPSTEFNYCGGSPITYFAKIGSGTKTLKASFSERIDAAITTVVPTSTMKGPMIVPLNRYFDSKFIKLRPKTF